ncbi:calponin homology domain-containing protein [Lipomyces oligophaga]|uniref:calponin homology domain-containing protein n=1 Tax=Lipomyces oligophaga TaxID=45792 RepID=UPI0034CDE3DC
MGESRQELLSWMNDLLHLNLTKIEQCGTGAPLCQIFDSIYGDVPMNKVKFNVNADYQYIPNFKVLQNVFSQHKIEKTIPVERLIKCKFQDNLEFLQWVKKFWDVNFPGWEYDPLARRKSGPASAGVSGYSHPIITRAGSAVSGRKSANGITANGSSVNGASTSTTATAVTGAHTAHTAHTRSRTPSVNTQIVQLQGEITSLNEAVTMLEKERDFYFNKLRQIEIILQTEVDQDAAQIEAGEKNPNTEKEAMIKNILDILYITEEGFEIPEESGEIDVQDDADEETF